MPSSTRWYADVAALLLHPGFLIAVVYGSEGSWNSLEGALLIAMEVVAIVAHAFYIYMYLHHNFDGAVNTYKWGEYSISATIGGLAVLASSTEEYPWQVPVLIAALGVSEQATGYTIDVAVDAGDSGDTKDIIIWSAAAVGQVCEFTVVGAYVGLTLPYVLYVVFWSLYGSWALLALRGYQDTLNVRETGYSVLSTLAKLSVFISSGFALER